MASPYSLADRIRIVFHALNDGQTVQLPSGPTVVLAQTADGSPTVGVVLYDAAPTEDRTIAQIGEYAPALTGFLRELTQLPDTTLLELGAVTALKRGS